MVTTSPTKPRARILELDYLKCVFILLMIVFHLVYIGNRYPVAKAFVYTFHMPGFLIISGYLLHVQKPVPQFLRYIQWILVPYLLMESGMWSWHLSYPFVNIFSSSPLACFLINCFYTLWDLIGICTR